MGMNPTFAESYGLDATSAEILENVLKALQDAEEINGPSLEQYIRLMVALEHEVDRRHREAVALLPGVRHTLPDAWTVVAAKEQGS